MLPTRYQLLTTPVANSVPTLTMPSAEKRKVAARTSAIGMAPCSVAANSGTKNGNVPIQAAAAIRCKTSAAG